MGMNLVARMNRMFLDVSIVLDIKYC